MDCKHFTIIALVALAAYLVSRKCETCSKKPINERFQKQTVGDVLLIIGIIIAAVLVMRYGGPFMWGLFMGSQM